MEDNRVTKFRKTLLDKKRSNLQKPFFAKDKNLQSIPTSITNSSLEKLIPFRNNICLYPTCLYDLDDLLEKFKQCGYTEYGQVTCFSCDSILILKNFFFDTTLAAEIDKLWNHYNTGTGQRLLQIQQFKDGHCGTLKFEPEPIEVSHHEPQKGVNVPYIKSLGPDLDEDLGIKLPKLNSFNTKEFLALFSNFSQGSKKVQKKAEPLGINISKEEIDNVVNDFNVSDNVMTFFSLYLRRHLKTTKLNPSDYILPFIVNDYQKFDQKLTFKYLSKFNNPFKPDPKHLLKENENIRLFLIYKYDERWMVSVITPKLKKCAIYDFLAFDLSKTTKEEHYGMLKAYLSQEFQLKPGSVSFYDRAKSQTYSDCGLYVCRFLANTLVNSIDPDNQSVSDSEKNTFKTVIPWLILKIHYNTSPESIGSLVLPDEKKSTFSPDRVSSDNLKAMNTNMRSFLDKGFQTQKSSTYKKLGTIVGKSSSGYDTSAKKTGPSNFLKKVSLMCESLSQSGISIEQDEEVNIKKPKRKGKESLKDIKEESSLEAQHGDTHRSKGIRRDSLEEPDNGKKAYSKSELKKILKDAQNLSEMRSEIEKKKIKSGEDDYLMAPEEYMRKYNEYTKQSNEFYTMLVYFQQNNPEMYAKIAQDINEQIQQKFLERMNLPSFRQSQPAQIQSPSYQVSPLTKRLAPINQSPAFNIDLAQGSARSSAKKKTIEPNSATTAATTKRADLAAKRYGVEVTVDDLRSFKENKAIAKAIFVMLFGYLQEKQAERSKEELIKSKTRILPLGPLFYETLTNNDPYSLNIDYEGVKELTQHYRGQGATIFDIFDRIAITVKGKGNAYMLVHIDNNEKRVILWDPNGKSDQSPVNHPILYNISQYMEQEFSHKANQTMNLAKWRFSYGESSKLEDPADSGALVMKIVHTMYFGASNGSLTNRELKGFKDKIVGLIEQIGITKNRRGELGDFNVYDI